MCIKALQSFSLATFKRFARASACVGLLAGLTACLPAQSREQFAFYSGQEWQAFKATQWTQKARDVTGLSEAFPNAREREMAAEAQLCNHTRTQNRVTTQNGVNDAIRYRQCPVPTHVPALGERLKDR